MAETFAMPREAESLPELERIVATLARREHRWRVYEVLAARAEIDLPAGELWLLVRLGEGTAVDMADPGLAAVHRSLGDRGLTDDGRLSGEGEALYERVVEARRTGLAELLEGWEPEQHDEVRRMLERLARQLVDEMPQAAVPR